MQNLFHNIRNIFQEFLRVFEYFHEPSYVSVCMLMLGPWDSRDSTRPTLETYRCSIDKRSND